MDKMRTLVTTLNSESVVVLSGFMIGFVNRVKFNTNTLENPLSSLFDASVLGFFTSLGAKIVASFLPSNLKFMIPTLAVLSCIYYKVTDFKKDNNKKIFSV
jgi:hypothetical protein